MAAPAAAWNFVPTGAPLVPALPIFSLRNGNPSDAKNLLVRATIGARYHWVPIEGLNPKRALAFAEGFVACYYARLRAIGGENEAEDISRKIAICLAISRCVAMAYFDVKSTDIMPGELAPAIMEYYEEDVPAAVDEAGAAIAAHGREGVRLRANAPYGAAAAVNPNITDIERNAITVLLRCSLGIVPLQGCSLVLTNHHYLSDVNSPSQRAYAAVEKQFWREHAIKDWVDPNKAIIQDALWHKSCHPINLVKEMLITVGAGSAAARLPALEPEARTATSYLALFDVLKPIYQNFGGGINTTLLEACVETIRSYPPHDDNPPPPRGRRPEVPAFVMNRRTALQLTADVVKRNTAIAAHCFGFYCAMAERSMAAAGTQYTLRSAFSLSKLAKSHHGIYVVGYEQFADFQHDLRWKQHFTFHCR